MRCRQCGTEIADKALICYRCGTATTEAKFKPAAQAGRRSGLTALVSVLALVLLIIAGLYMGSAATGERPRILGWIVAGLAVLILAIRLLLRRR
jgi:hypothetical protein